jgi:hypothetical protein
MPTTGKVRLVDDPAPVAGAFDGDVAVRWKRLEKGTEGRAIMFDADQLGTLAACVDCYKN